MKIKLYLFIALLTLFILHPIASSFNIPADIDQINDEPSIRGAVEASAVTSENSGDTGGHNFIVGEQGEGISAPIQLRKEISPDGNYSYLVNNTLRVRVEILLTGKELDTVQILESIHPSLIVSNISKIYIVNNIIDLPKIERGLDDLEHIDKFTKGISAFEILKNKNSFNNITNEFENDSLYINKYKINEDEEYSSMSNSNNTFIITKSNRPDANKISTDNIGKKGRIIYWYFIKPTEPGTYSTRTIVRTSDKYQDLDQITKINVMEHNPQFEVIISGKKLEVDCGEELNISYNIKYLGGSTSPIACDISIDSASTDYEIKAHKSSYKNESFKLNEEKKVNFIVSYPDEGKYYLPDLLISSESASKEHNKYTFKGEVIDVIGPIKKNEDLITWIILGLGIMISQIFCKELNSIIIFVLNKLYHGIMFILNIIQGIRLFDPLLISLRNTWLNSTMKRKLENVAASSMEILKRLLKYTKKQKSKK